jgi:hypothetical protein
MASPVVVSRIQNRRGTQDQFNALYPLGYTGTGGCDILLYPDILLPGELALCTDSRRIFLGNENGEYVEIPIVLGDGIFLHPLRLTLIPAASFTQIPELDYLSTPFFTLLYDLTDDTLMEDWNTVGTNFSKNGELKITAINNEPTDASLTDTGTEINLTPLYDISFKAVYNNDPLPNSPHIEIWYTHNFPTNLTFSTSTISWISFS